VPGSALGAQQPYDAILQVGQRVSGKLPGGKGPGDIGQ